MEINGRRTTIFSHASHDERRRLLIGLATAISVHAVVLVLLAVFAGGSEDASRYMPPVYVELNAPTVPGPTSAAVAPLSPGPPAEPITHPVPARIPQTPSPVPSERSSIQPPASSPSRNQSSAQSPPATNRGSAVAGGTNPPAQAPSSVAATSSGGYPAPATGTSNLSENPPPATANPGIYGSELADGPVTSTSHQVSTPSEGRSSGNGTAAPGGAIRTGNDAGRVAFDASSIQTGAGTENGSGGSTIIPESAKGPIPATVAELQRNRQELQDWLAKYSGSGGTSAGANGPGSSSSSDGAGRVGTVGSASSATNGDDTAAYVRARLNQIDAALKAAGSSVSSSGSSGGSPTAVPGSGNSSSNSSGNGGSGGGSGVPGPSAVGPGATSGYQDAGIVWPKSGTVQRFLTSSDRLALDQAKVNQLLRQYPNHPAVLTIQVRFDVEPDGFVLNLQLVQASGYTQLDQMVMDLFRGRVFIQSPGSPPVVGEKKYVLTETGAR